MESTLIQTAEMQSSTAVQIRMPTGRRLLWAAIAGCLVYVLGLSYLSIARHAHLQTQMNDLGNMTQAIDQAARGNLSMPVSNDTDGTIRSRLGIHTNFVFLLFAPLFKLAPYPEILLVLSSLACGLAGLGIFFFARLHLGADRAVTLLPALAFWLSPIVHDANLFDFHVVTVAAACVVWMLWAFDSGRPAIGWLLAAVALLCQEDIALMVIGLGVYYAGRHSTRRRGWILAGAAGIWFAAAIFAVGPHFQGSQTVTTVVASRTAWLGRNYIEIAGSLLSRPIEIAFHCANPEYLRLPVYLLISGGFLALSQWRFLLASAPPVVLALLSGFPWMTRISGTYYWIGPISLIIIACILATKADAGEMEGQGERSVREGRRDALRDNGPANGRGSEFLLGSKKLEPVPWRLRTLFWITGIVSAALSPLPYGLNSSASTASWNHRAATTLERVTKLIPPGASVSVQNNLGAHLALRADVAAYPRRSATADFLLFHLGWEAGANPTLFPSYSPEMLYQMPPDDLGDAVRMTLRSPKWELTRQEEGFYLFRRREADREPGIRIDSIAPAWNGSRPSAWRPDKTGWVRTVLFGLLIGGISLRIEASARKGCL